MLHAQVLCPKLYTLDLSVVSFISGLGSVIIKKYFDLQVEKLLVFTFEYGCHQVEGPRIFTIQLSVSPPDTESWEVVENTWLTFGNYLIKSRRQASRSQGC